MTGADTQALRRHACALLAAIDAAAAEEARGAYEARDTALGAARGILAQLPGILTAVVVHRTHADWSLGARLWAERRPVREIAERLNVSMRAVWKARLRYGWPTRAHENQRGGLAAWHERRRAA